MRKIDIHGHYQPQSLISDETGIGYKEVNNQFFLDMGYPIGPISEGMWNLPKRFEEMDSFKIDQQLLSAVPSTFGYSWNIKKAKHYTSSYNEEIADLQARYPNRFIAFGSLPLQSPVDSGEMIEYGINSLGLKGFEIGTDVNSKPLDDPSFDIVYKKCEDLDVPLLLHPHIAERLTMPYTRFNFKVIIYFPLQTTIAAASLVYGGVMDKFPNLKIILAHGGGFYPYQKGRFDHTFSVRKQSYRELRKKPSEYFKSFYYDSVTHDSDALRFLLDFVGIDHVLFGSDAPFDMAPLNPSHAIEQLDLPEREQAKIYHENAKRLLKL